MNNMKQCLVSDLRNLDSSAQNNGHLWN
jgi:hypothetical protein